MPLDLQVCESSSHDRPSRTIATISKVFSMTMSVVLDVTLPSRHGPPVHRVLKLYDRRFGSCLRDIGEDNSGPHTQQSEAEFEAFVRGGMMPAFLRYLKNRNETELFPVAAQEFLDEPNHTSGLAKYEAVLWQNCINHFECETEAYKRLADIQGKSIPRMLAQVNLQPSHMTQRPTSTSEATF